jgi:Domain of unknown function (DUF4387)
MNQFRPLSELASVVRSKNAGPHRLTLDVLFTSPDTFDKVADSGALTVAAVAEAYGVPESVITSSCVFRPGLAFKFTMRRPRVQGAVGDSDHYGAQQHAPLLDILIPWDAGDTSGSAAAPRS